MNMVCKLFTNYKKNVYNIVLYCKIILNEFVVTTFFYETVLFYSKMMHLNTKNKYSLSFTMLFFQNYMAAIVSAFSIIKKKISPSCLPILKYQSQIAWITL